VVIEAPLFELVGGGEAGFELVKVLLEKLWQDCTTSVKRVIQASIQQSKLAQKQNLRKIEQIKSVAKANLPPPSAAPSTTLPNSSHAQSLCTSPRMEGPSSLSESKQQPSKTLILNQQNLSKINEAS
jgi:hypothetical protein